jgi:hypothetical protein
MKYFSVAPRDIRVEAYMQPTFVNHTGAAVRAFTEHCKDSKSDFARNPEDFELYLLGSFDDTTGLFSPPDSGAPERLLRAIDCVIKS